MTPLDIISLSDAKNYIKVDFGDDDALITSLISAAIAMVEQATNYRLYQRDELVYTSRVFYEAYQYPLNGYSVINHDSADTNIYTVKYKWMSLRTELFWGNGYWYTDYNNQFFAPDVYNLSGCTQNYVLTLDVGYTTVGDIPNDLITAAKEIIASAYENREATKEELLSSVGLLLTNYRRFATIL